MTVKEFLDCTTKINETFYNKNEIITFLEKIASLNPNYVDLCVGLRESYVASNANATFSKINPVITKLFDLERSTLKSIREYKPRIIVTELNELKDELNKAKILNGKLNSFLDEDIQKLIDYHTDAYSEKDFREIFTFVSFTSHFVEKLDKVKFISEIFLENLKLEPLTIPKNNLLFEIQIVSELDNLKNFSFFILFLDKFYQDLCRSFELHYEDFPLSIIKIESGSIWTKLFGNENIINLIKDFIFGIGGYIRDLQTGQIKKEQFKNKIEQAGLVLDLIKKAYEIGVKKDKKVLLEKTFGQAIDNISKSLPESTTEIIIDDTKLLNLNTRDIKLIEGRKTMLLRKNNSKSDKK